MKYRFLLVALFASLFCGCAVQSVQPWQRDLLSEENMQLIPDPVQNGLDEHIYFSKEASMGGQGVGGGGCGCN
ncbi:MAG: DUF4266 domain-containing protein [Calditrichaeota bacterium]|nr:DUF4266 domain-containing protein [Calditrichota bacterium]MCB9365758.1 DUF4266 domain-containing protein [Calditrichota bacterium]